MAKPVVPLGCSSIRVTPTVLSGQGMVVASSQPSADNGWLGEIIFKDYAADKASVYDVRVQMECYKPKQALLGSVAVSGQRIRLSCAHTGSACKQGRVEVYNPSKGGWGTICGHGYLRTDTACNMACTQLGFGSGTCYTFGESQLLAPLPTVAGFRECQGNEKSLLQCKFAKALTNNRVLGNPIQDRVSFQPHARSSSSDHCPDLCDFPSSHL